MIAEQWQPNGISNFKKLSFKLTHPSKGVPPMWRWWPCWYWINPTIWELAKPASRQVHLHRKWLGPRPCVVWADWIRRACLQQTSRKLYKLPQCLWDLSQSNCDLSQTFLWPVPICPQFYLRYIHHRQYFSPSGLVVAKVCMSDVPAPNQIKVKIYNTYHSTKIAEISSTQYSTPLPGPAMYK